MINKTPNCNMREPLVSYLYDEASAEERGAVESHLIECAACQQELEAFQRVRGMLQQWQLDDLPVARVSAEAAPESRRSFLAALRELLTLTPAWAKAVGAVAIVALLLSVMGTEISIGRDGFSMRMNLLRGPAQTEPNNQPSDLAVNTSAPALTRAEVEAMINRMIIESEKQHREELKAQLVSFESQLSTMHSSEFAKLASRIQEQRAKIKTLERDIDRREGLDLTDILFSEMTTDHNKRPNSGADGD